MTQISIKKIISGIIPVIVLLLFIVKIANHNPEKPLLLGTAVTSSNYSQCKLITVDNTKVTADLSGYPTLIDLTDSDLASQADSDGGDITFTDSSGEILNFEIENFTKGTGTLTAWASTTLANSSDTVIRMYYGTTTTITPLENPTGVWDANYKAVWHLKEGDSTSANFYQDSTSNNNDLTLTDADGDTTAITGKADGAIKTTDATDYLTSASMVFDPNGTALSAEVWGSFGGANCSASDTILSQIDGTGTGRGWLYCKSTVVLASNLGSTELSGGAISLGTEMFFAMTLAGTGSATQTLYVNGASTASGAKDAESATGAMRVASGKAGTIGSRGIVDEVRISDTLRSGDWIATEYNNVSATSTFYSISAEYDNTCAPTASGSRSAGTILDFE